MNKKLLTFILLCISALLPGIVKANHAAGGELIYQHVSDSTYRIIFKFYRDCTGPTAPVVQPLCITDMVTGITITDNFDTVAEYGPSKRVQVSAGCSEYPTVCADPTSTLPGYEEYWYSKVITLPNHTNFWKFSTFIGNRNNSLNLLGGTGLIFYIETAFDNTISDTNSSPYFSMKPVPYLCINQPYSYNNGAVDVDGDSLVTDMVVPFDFPALTCGAAPVAATFVPVTPPYNLTNNPLQTNNSFVLNPSSGQMNFTATATGAYTITTRVKEYRNGRLIGYIMRDVQVQVLPCSTVPPSFNINPANVVNGAFSNNTVYGCIDQALGFCFDVVSSDTDAVLIVGDNHSASVPDATVTYEGQLGDSIRGCFSWTPGSADAGSRTLIINTKDSTCKPPGIMLYYSYSIQLYIWPPTKTVEDTSVCPGQTAFLNATGGGSYVWTVKPGGSPISTISNPNIANPVATPGVKTTYVVTSTVNSYCNNNSDEVTVDVLPGLDFQKLNDTITCPDNPVMLDLKINPPAGATYTMKWKPGIFLSDSTSDKPIATLKSSQVFSVILESSSNLCKGYDTVLVDVLTGFKIENPDTAICQGQSVQVRTTGDSRYTYSWTTNSPVPGAVTNPAIKDPLITPSNIGNYKYILKASYSTCAEDSIADFSIDVQPTPTVIAGDDTKVCFGDTMQLNGIVMPNDYPFTLSWTPGASLNNASVVNPIFSASATTNLTFKATTSARCSDEDDILLTVFPGDFLFTNNDTSICPGNDVQLHLTGNGIQSFYWYPEVNISDKFSYNPVVSPTNTQTYMAIGIDTNACADTALVKVVVHPGASIILPDSVTLYPGQSYSMNPIGNAMYYSWFPNVGLSKADVSNPTAKPDVNTRYYVTATTEFGCTTADSIDIIVNAESILTMPNAFTPGAAPNDLLKIVRLGDATLKKFAIFNRWGAKVFETSDINEGWNGKYKNEPQPVGVYIYTIEAITPSGRTFQKQGNITLLR